MQSCNATRRERNAAQSSAAPTTHRTQHNTPFLLHDLCFEMRQRLEELLKRAPKCTLKLLHVFIPAGVRGGRTLACEYARVNVGVCGVATFNRSVLPMQLFAGARKSQAGERAQDTAAHGHAGESTHPSSSRRSVASPLAGIHASGPALSSTDSQ